MSNGASPTEVPMAFPRLVRRLLIPFAAITVLIALIVLGSRSYTESQAHAQANSAAADAISDVLVTIVMVATVASAVLLVWIFWPQRRRRRGKDDEEFEPYVEPEHVHWTVKVALAVVPCLLVAGLVYAVYTGRIGGSSSETEAPVSGPISPLAPTQVARTGSGEPVTTTASDTWGPIIAAAILIAAALVVCVWMIRWRANETDLAIHPPEPATPTLAEDLATALDESLDDLYRDRDPRRAVIAAYARMEATLARHGLPRRREETPHEYAARVLRDLGLGSGAVRGLTRLYELARFSQHDIGASMQQQAITALTAIREEL